jgi:hypothetical protein
MMESCGERKVDRSGGEGLNERIEIKCCDKLVGRILTK